MSTACCRGHFSRMKNRARGCRVRVPFLSVMPLSLICIRRRRTKIRGRGKDPFAAFCSAPGGKRFRNQGKEKYLSRKCFSSVFHLNDREWCPRSVMRIPDRHFLLKKGTCQRQVPKKFRIFPYVGIVQIRFRVQTVQPVLSPLLRAPLCFLIRYCSLLPCVRQEKTAGGGITFLIRF